MTESKKTRQQMLEEDFLRHCRGKIEFIAVNRDFTLENTHLIECNSLFFSTSGKNFIVSCLQAGFDQYQFRYKECGNYNQKEFPRKILSTEEEKIRFACQEKDNVYSYMWFYIGERPILVTAAERFLMIGLSRLGKDGSWVEYENDLLLNDGLPIDE